MRRRRLLATLAAGATGLAGCSGSGRDTPTLTPVAVPEATRAAHPGAGTPGAGGGTGGGRTTSATPPSSKGPRLVRLETVPRALALVPEATGRLFAAVAFTATATHAHPARLRIAFTNPYEVRREFRFGRTPPFSDLRGDPVGGGDGTMLLVPTGESGPRRSANGCWQATSRPTTGTGALSIVTLSPGETLAREYHLLAPPDGCLPTGRYAFTARYGWTITVVAWNPEAPGPRAASRFEGVAVPDLPAGPTAWYHEADRTTGVYLEPSTERVAPPGRVGFAFHNHTGGAVTGNADDWRLLKLHDGAWKHIAPDAVPTPLTEVRPGDLETWTLRVARHLAGGSDDDLRVGGLGGGRYAFRAALSHDGSTVHAALFDLDGGALAVSPDGSIERTVRRGDTLVVYSGTERDEATQLLTLVVERVDDGPARELVPEQVVRLRGLRNSLPYLVDDPGIRQVRLQTSARVASEVSEFVGDARRLRYEGVTVESWVARE